MSESFRYEQAFIGAVVLTCDQHGGIDLEPSHFENEAFARVWAHVRDQQRVDVVDLESTFINEREAIADATHSVPGVFRLEKYAMKIREYAARRKFLATLDHAKRMMQEGASLDDVRALVQEADDLPSGDSKPVGDYLIDAYRDIERAQIDGEVVNFIPSGFIDFDAAFGGLQKDGLVIVAGRPSMGKSAFAASLAKSAGQRGKVLMISMEMTGRQLAHRFFASEAGVDLQRMGQGRLGTDDWRKLSEVSSRLAGNGIHINDKSSRTVTDVVAEARRFKRKHGTLELIVIDYLTLLDLPEAQNKAESVSKATRALKCLAGEVCCPIILLSQLNRDLEKRPDKRPTMADLRDSGAIEQDADQIIFPFRPEVYSDELSVKGISIITMAKNRNGITGAVRMAWHAESATFHNLKRDGF